MEISQTTAPIENLEDVFKFLFNKNDINIFSIENQNVIKELFF